MMPTPFQILRLKTHLAGPEAAEVKEAQAAAVARLVKVAVAESVAVVGPVG